ncbi:ClpP/crotonase [Rhizodiscina lignyota]|uniref:ClpP/crotonase n=1 Tax=Rhizodiscina lignyota TaxID=1504668 RepID=A0A9P4M8N1_9PEZI|nr:ClpP/crotonase [Rhizodiscina lignyota]
MDTVTKCLQNLEKEDDGLRAVFLSATIAGADLNFMRDIDSPASARTFIQHIDLLCRTIQDFSVPVVAVTDGPCLGAGMEVAAACDLRVATRQGTVFGMPETRVGLPSVVQATLIPGLVGWGRARELLYFGDVIDADVALQWGFVNAVVDREALDDKIKEWEDKFSKTAPGALVAQKALMRTWEERGTGRPGIDASIEAFGRAFETGEPRRSIEAHFMERSKRKKQ